MNRPQRLFKVEILVFLLGRHADIAARRQAPVVRFDLVSVYELHQAFDIPQFGFGETLLQPVGLPQEIARPLKRLDGSGPCVPQRLADLVDFNVVPEVRFPRIEFLHRDVDRPPGHLRRQIDLFGQFPAALGNLAQSFACRVQGGIVPRPTVPTLVPVGSSRRDFGSQHLNVGR